MCFILRKEYYYYLLCVRQTTLGKRVRVRERRIYYIYKVVVQLSLFSLSRGDIYVH